MVLLFARLGFGWNGQGILLNHASHSRKLIVVWTELEPLPLIGLVCVLWAIAVVSEAFAIRWLVERVNVRQPPGQRPSRF
jgi:hypothetical protein